MKTLLVISDTHGNKKGVDELLPLIAENHYVLHLGDGAGDMWKVRADYPDKVYACAGNCDFYSPMPQEGVLEVERCRIFYCHGHKYRVKSHLTDLALAAKEHDCNIALYGHTHCAKITQIEGITLINPGTLSRRVGKGGSYAYLVIEKDKCTPVIVGDVYQ